MIYLDSAATTLEKPQAVSARTAWAMTHLASPGRGGYGAGMGRPGWATGCGGGRPGWFTWGTPSGWL